MTRFLEAMADGDSEEVLGLLASDSAFSLISREALQVALLQSSADIATAGGLADVEITESKETGDVARVFYKVTYGNGQEETARLTLVKEAGDWKIQPTS